MIDCLDSKQNDFKNNSSRSSIYDTQNWILQNIIYNYFKQLLIKKHGGLTVRNTVKKEFGEKMTFILCLGTPKLRLVNNIRYVRQLCWL